MTSVVLVTGATGFIGRHVLNELARRGFEIRIVSRKSIDNSLIARVHLTEDIFSESLVWWKKVFQGVDLVIHLAWYVQHNDYQNSIENWRCSEGTFNIAKIAHALGVARFVGIGTCYEYDLSQRYLSSSAMLKPRTVYSRAKAELYVKLRDLFSDNPRRFLWGRIFYLYGDGEDRRRLIPYIEDSLVQGRRVIIRNSDYVRDYSNVVDVAKMIVERALDPSIEGAFNVCSGRGQRLGDLAIKIAKKYEAEHLLDLRNEDAEDGIDFVVGVP